MEVYGSRMEERRIQSTTWVDYQVCTLVAVGSIAHNVWGSHGGLHEEDCPQGHIIWQICCEEI